MRRLRFARKTEWELSENPLARLLEKKRAQGRTIVDLTGTNPLQCGFEYPEREILEALAQHGSLSYAPDPKGLRAAREAVAAYYRARGFAVDPERIVLTSSTSEAYSFLFKLLADPGDEVLVPSPSYPLFDYLTQLESVAAVPYALSYEGRWSIDLDSVEAVLGERTRALLVVSPNNPTGSLLRSDEAEQLQRLAARAGVPLICDEVFADYVWAPGRAGILPAGAPLRREASPSLDSFVQSSAVLSFTLSGLSKVVGLPQLKLGWMVVSGPESEVEEALRRLEVIADTYLSVNTPVQVALPRLLALRETMQRQILERARGNLALLTRELQSSAATVLAAEGCWSAVVSAPLPQGEERFVLDLLEDQDLLVHPGFFFDMPEEGFLVLSLLPQPDLFAEGVERLVQRLG